MQRSNAVVVAFIDICSSTQLFAERGNEVALAMTSLCLASLRAIISQVGGTVIQSLGDGILCTFPESDTAYKAADKLRESGYSRELPIHAGFDYGEVIFKENSVFGDAVNSAARITDVAQQEEFIFSEQMVARIAPALRVGVQSLGGVMVKGKTDPLNLYILKTQDSADTAYVRVDSIQLELAKQIQLALRYQDKDIVLDEEIVNFVIGRQGDCQLTIDQSCVSRRHATILFHQGLFFLEDHSTNGSYVIDHLHQLSVLKRSRLQLHGIGHISLGIIPEKNQSHLIRFRVHR